MSGQAPPGQDPPGHLEGLAVLPAGPEALLLEVASLDEVLALAAAIRGAVARAHGPWGAVTDIVPAARTVLVVARPGSNLSDLAAAARTLAPESAPSFIGSPDNPPVHPTSVPVGSEVLSGEELPLATLAGSHPDVAGVVEIVVRYDGPDLDEVAALTGLTPEQVVLAHTATPWRVAFGGFVPGFAYLVGGDPRLHVPRRDTPRPSVAAGSVALAGEFTGVYPRPSPGGWQLIGTTDAPLWDPDREPPALLTPGRTVRFVDVEARMPGRRPP